MIGIAQTVDIHCYLSGIIIIIKNEICVKLFSIIDHT